MRVRYPDIISKYSHTDAGERSVLHVCLEENHMDHVGYKIASMVRYAHIKRLTALTVDGSPHCIQLHYLIEDIKRHFTPEIETKHIVVEKGEDIMISPEAVKQSRHLSKIEKSLT